MWVHQTIAAGNRNLCVQTLMLVTLIHTRLYQCYPPALLLGRPACKTIKYWAPSWSLAPPPGCVYSDLLGKLPVAAVMVIPYTRTTCTLSSYPSGNFELKGNDLDCHWKRYDPEGQVGAPDAYLGILEQWWSEWSCPYGRKSTSLVPPVGPLPEGCTQQAQQGGGRIWCKEIEKRRQRMKDGGQ